MYLPLGAVLLVIGILLILLTAGALHTIGIVCAILGAALLLYALFAGRRTRV